MIIALALLLPLSLEVQAQWGSPPQADVSAADSSLRISQLESKIRELNGLIEQQQFQLKQMQDQLRRFQEDTEFRFNELQGGKAQPSTNTKPQKRSDVTEQDPVMNALTQSATTATVQSQSPSPLAPQPLGQLQTNAAGEPINIGAPPVAVNQPQQVAAVSAPTENPKDEYDLAYGFMLRGDYDMADMSFRNFIDKHPRDANVPNAHYWLGESLYQRKQYKDAAENFLKVYNNYPTAQKAPESLLRLGMSLKQLGQKDPACATLAEVSRKYPKSSQAVKTRVEAERRAAGC